MKCNIITFLWCLNLSLYFWCQNCFCAFEMEKKGLYLSTCVCCHLTHYCCLADGIQYVHEDCVISYIVISHNPIRYKPDCWCFVYPPPPPIYCSCTGLLRVLLQNKSIGDKYS